MFVIISLFPLVFAYMLDMILGDPRWLYHPVRVIGKEISGLEKLLRRIFPATPKGERHAGMVLAAVLPLASCLIMLAVMVICYHVNPWLAFIVDTFACFQLMANRSLRVESMAVYRCLNSNDLPKARKMVGRIVGRDTDCLDESGVARAAVETVAENTSDGIIAPMLFMAFGASPLAYFYKTINTLDSMVGYKNDRYLNFGRASAKLDDFVNYLPARLSARLMISAAKNIQADADSAKHIYLRDRSNHSSPNSAHTEAVCAGALGIQLGGDSVYFGKVVHKPTIGDATRPIEKEDIIRANRLSSMTASSCLILCCFIRAAVIGLAALLF